MRVNRIIWGLCFVFYGLQVKAQPKLVIGLVIDQMRYDYLNIYQNGFCDSGFNYLIGHGANYTQMHYNYVPTYTGPGHASIYTGSTPSVHGIAANDWLDRKTGKEVYCTDEITGEKNGKISMRMSPANLQAPVIGDQLKITTPQSRVFSVALKDRASILPAGKLADGVYWFDGSTGGIITSDFYANGLPQWVKDYNRLHPASEYLKNDWTLLLPETFYAAKIDLGRAERPFKGEKEAIFPHCIPKLTDGKSTDLLRSTPFGNDYTLDFAESLIFQQKLGRGQATDMICISLSSTDYIGHQFGLQSRELMDTYFRLDRRIAAFIHMLNTYLGQDKYLLFLTADHGAANNPLVSGDSCFYSEADILQFIQNKSNQWFGYQIFENVMNEQVYVNTDEMEKAGISLTEVSNRLQKELSAFNVVAAVNPMDICACVLSDQKCMSIKNGYYPGRSGDIFLVFKNGCIPASFLKGGTTHGSCYTYDSHVPFIICGNIVKPITIISPASITDIAPTISAIMGIEAPQGSMGHNIYR